MLELESIAGVFYKVRITQHGNDLNQKTARLVSLRHFSDSGCVWQRESLKYVMVFQLFIAKAMLHRKLPPTFFDLEQLQNKCSSQICRQARGFFWPQLGLLNWVLSQHSICKKALMVLTGLIYMSVGWRVASDGTTEEIQVYTSRLMFQQAWQKNKRGTENARLLSQASTFCKFATLPLAKASYMARNSQYGRPLTKGMSEKRGKKLGVLTQAINHQWHLEQQL